MLSITSFICITRLKLIRSFQEKERTRILGKIPTLRNLKLSNAYDGKEMICSAMDFSKLTGLKLAYLGKLKNWRVEEGSMPILSELFHYKKNRVFLTGYFWPPYFWPNAVTIKVKLACHQIKAKIDRLILTAHIFDRKTSPTKMAGKLTFKISFRSNLSGQF